MLSSLFTTTNQRSVIISRCNTYLNYSYLNYSIWGSNSNPESVLHSLPTENHSFRLGDANSHPIYFTLGWKMPQCKTNKTTSSEKNRDHILKPASTLWLHLEIIILKVIKRIRDKWQPWQRSPTMVVQGMEKTKHS